MDGRTNLVATHNQDEIIAQLNRVLEVGRLLLSMLTPEELDQLKLILANRVTDCVDHTISFIDADHSLGNASVT